MTQLERILVERIRRTGPMPFAAFMQIALYDAIHGYYARSPRTGWRGDFVTAPELDPAFGTLWARAFERVWDACGRPDEFAIVEVGPGEGGFAAAVLDAVPGSLKDRLRYVLVERMPDAERRQRDLLQEHSGVVGWVGSIVDLEPVADGVIFANEVLDNAPVHVVEMHDGALTEIDVGLDGDRLVEVSVEPSNPELEAFLERCGVGLEEGARIEVPLAAESMARRLAGLVRRGALVFVDYGDNAAALSLRHEGTLISYSQAGPSTDVLSEPGARDITSHANWTSIDLTLRAAGMDVQGPLAQADVLRSLGLGDLDRELRARHDRAVAEKRGVDAVAALSRRNALRTLIDPDGLGGFGVVAGTRGIDIGLLDG